MKVFGIWALFLIFIIWCYSWHRSAATPTAYILLSLFVLACSNLTPGTFLYALALTPGKKPTPYFTGFAIAGVFLFLVFAPAELYLRGREEYRMIAKIPEILSPLGYCVEVEKQNPGFTYYCGDVQWYCEFRMQEAEATARCWNAPERKPRL